MSETADFNRSYIVSPPRRTDASEFARKIVAAVLLLLAGGLVADTITTVVRLHSWLPYWDEWDNLALLKALITRQAGLSELFSQNNEHRIFFPRLLMFSDYLFFGGRGILNLLTILTVQLTHAALLLLLLQKSSPRTLGRIALASVIMMLLFSLRQEENFSWGLQVSFVGVYALSTLAIVIFSRSLMHLQSGRPFRLEMLAAFIVVSIATYTMANGILSAFVFTVLAVLHRAPIKVVLAPVGLAAVLLSFYLHQYEPMSGHSSMLNLGKKSITLLSYTSVCLGNFLYPSYKACRALGLFGIIAAVITFIRVIRTDSTNYVRLALFGVILFTGMSALVTEAGRFQFGIDQTFSSRYAVAGGVFWSALLIYWWSVGSATARMPATRVVVVLTAIVLVVGVVRAQAAMKEGMEDRAAQQRLATDALLLGVKDEGSFGAINDPTESLTDVSDFLRDRSISIFGLGDALLIGRAIDVAGRIVSAADCQGRIDDVSLAAELALPNAARISGQVWGRRGHRSTDSVYVVDASQTIVGLGTRGSPIKDPTAWNGFVLSRPNTLVSAFTRLADGGLCKLGSATVGGPG